MQHFLPKMLHLVFERAGLKTQAAVDMNPYVKGIKITDKEMKTLAIKKNEFHGEWNFTLHPRKNA